MPNEIVLINPDNDLIASEDIISEFVNRYRISVAKTAESILELANTVYSAKKQLSITEFAKFRDAIGADSRKDSYIKKLCIIAANQSRFENIIDQLPASYTTLYTLANIDESVFSDMLQKNVINPQMTAGHLSKCVQSNNVKVKTKAHSSADKACVRFQIDFENLDYAIAKQITKQMSDMLEKHGIVYHYDLDLTNAYFPVEVQDEVFDEKLAA